MTYGGRTLFFFRFVPGSCGSGSISLDSWSVNSVTGFPVSVVSNSRSRENVPDSAPPKDLRGSRLPGDAVPDQLLLRVNDSVSGLNMHGILAPRSGSRIAFSGDAIARSLRGSAGAHGARVHR